MFVLEAIKKYAGMNRTAIVSRGWELTYAQLDRRSDAFAAWLDEQYPNSTKPVIIYGDKHPDFLPCIFGALKSGRAYVPVDSVVPRSRMAEIEAEISPDVVVDFTVPDGGVLKSILQTAPAAQIPRGRWVSGSDTVYILFTSGSTGKPKGVPVTAANLDSFYRGLIPFMGDEGGVILDQVSYSFDVSGCSVYAGISRGMTLISLDRETVEDMPAMFDFLRGSGLTTWVSTPSFAEICARSKVFTSELMPKLERFLFCGEVLPGRLCAELNERFPGAGVLNAYGPTEATVMVTAIWVTPEMHGDPRGVPIGSPIGGVKLKLDTENGGELLILGDQVAPCYLERPELTAERFFTDAETGLRGYRTGDICTEENGLYYYRGRRDNQLKLHGHRIELEDIESNLARVENIAQAAVIPVWENGRAQYLAAFVLLKQDDGLTSLKRTIEIKKHAGEYLPAYMIPRKIITLDAFPLNINGKVDKKELAARLDAK
ncbi:MAG: AMP-binding protein [Oscillospiraceae bacterium]|nr:AMP-binding protein [Oscillospiraceae bacterium]